MTDMIPRLSLPLRLKTFLRKVELHERTFLLEVRYRFRVAYLWSCTYQHISLIEQVCRLYNCNFFFHTHCEMQKAF